MRALSGLTPALSRRLQRQLLAHLPPAAARSLRRTLSLHAAPPPAPQPARAHSADHEPAPEPVPATSDTPDSRDEDKEKTPVDVATPQYSTLPRPRRRSSSREVTPTLAAVDVECSSPNSLVREPLATRPRDRPLLSKYLTPERALSLDESYGSDCGSGSGSAEAAGGAAGAGLRRHSLRAPSTTEQPRRRVSRFLRSDFFDSPPDENLYERQRKEREMETQKILREIREKRNKSLDMSTVRSPTEVTDAPPAFRDDGTGPKKSLSPIGLLANKDRSRSNTPFFPILDNIKESAVDTSMSSLNSKRYANLENIRQKSTFDDSSSKDSKLIRPKSYPAKTLESIDEPNDNTLSENSYIRDFDSKERSLPRESKLIRPKSYPASSPSPEKVYISRNVKVDDSKESIAKEELSKPQVKSDVEVSFSITLPKKKPEPKVAKSDSVKNNSTLEQSAEVKLEIDKKPSDTSLSLKKYQVIKNNEKEKSEITESKTEKSIAIANGGPNSDVVKVTSNGDTKHKVTEQPTTKEEVASKTEADQVEKKTTVKKKIIRKVSSKSKADLTNNQETSDVKTTEKKKVTKKVKEKVADDDGTKPATVTKKKSVLQSIGHKLEKFASTKSSSPEKGAETSIRNDTKKDSSKLSRLQREQSVPVNVAPTTESNLIKRAVTLTDVAALDTQNAPQSKTTVSKVLGLFKKFEPKERTKPIIEKAQTESLQQPIEATHKTECSPEPVDDSLDKDKPRRPTSLLLNGLGRKSKYGRTSSDSVSAVSVDNEDLPASKKENEIKNIRNSLKLDFSRLPRVKKIVPTNPVIEPQIINISSVDSETEKKDIPEKNTALLDSNINIDIADTYSRSRSRSRSTISNSELKSDISADKISDRNPLSPSENTTLHLRSHDSTTPEKEDIVDRIRRKSFYSRFNEKKQRRKSSLVGPGAAEYDPVSRIHSQTSDTKYDASPSTSPLAYDLSPLSPGLSVSSDLSPSTERYRSLLTDLPVNTRSNLRFDNYGLNDKIDTYRSLDRNDFKKYPGSRSYLDYEQPSSYGTNRYSRTKSLLDSSDGTEDNGLSSLRDPLKYNRTISMYSPGSYATYRPKRTTRNSAIILKESEKEPSPENILEKIRQRKKISISVTRKPDAEKEPLPRCVCFCTYMSRK